MCAIDEVCFGSPVEAAPCIHFSRCGEVQLIHHKVSPFLASCEHWTIAGITVAIGVHPHVNPSAECEWRKETAIAIAARINRH
jgi:hypothetical protein